MFFTKIGKIIQREVYIAITGSTSHGSGTSRFIVKVLDKGILAKNALGPCTVWSVPLKSSCRIMENIRRQIKWIWINIIRVRCMLPLTALHICNNSSMEGQPENSANKSNILLEIVSWTKELDYGHSHQLKRATNHLTDEVRISITLCCIVLNFSLSKFQIVSVLTCYYI